MVILGLFLILICCVVSAAASIDVMVEFSGRPSQLSAPQLEFIADIFIASYNDLSAKSGTITEVSIDSTHLEMLFHEDDATQPFTMLFSVTCSRCKGNRLFKPQNSQRDTNALISRFNEIILSDAGWMNWSIDTLIGLQQIEQVQCPTEDSVSFLSTDLQVILDVVKEPTEDEWAEVGLALQESYNFINSVAYPSHRCNKSFPKVTSVKASDEQKRALLVAANTQEKSRIGSSRKLPRWKPFGYYFTLTTTCSRCPRDTSLLGDDGSRRHLDEKADIPRFSRVLVPQEKMECKCPIDADTDGPAPKSEFVEVFLQDLRILQKEGKLGWVADIIDVVEPK